MNPALLIQRCNSIAFFHRERCYANCGESQKKRHSIKHNLLPAQTAIFVAVSSTYYAIYPPGNVSHWQSLGCKSSPHLMLSLIHISEPTRLGMTSYAVFCLKK